MGGWELNPVLLLIATKSKAGSGERLHAIRWTGCMLPSSDVKKSLRHLEGASSPASVYTSAETTFLSASYSRTPALTPTPPTRL